MSTGKLVRDEIPKIIRASGQEPVTRIMQADEYRAEAERKLKEEVAEYLQDRNPDELADVLEVVYALGALDGHSREELEERRLKKVAERGAFEKRIYLVS